MTVVKKLTQMNLTVCATIHSPTPYCFNQFDRLHLLLRGQTVYFGPNGVLHLIWPASANCPVTVQKTSCHLTLLSNLSPPTHQASQLNSLMMRWGNKALLTQPRDWP